MSSSVSLGSLSLLLPLPSLLLLLLSSLLVVARRRRENNPRRGGVSFEGLTGCFSVASEEERRAREEAVDAGVSPVLGWEEMEEENGGGGVGLLDDTPGVVEAAAVPTSCVIEGVVISCSEGSRTRSLELPWSWRSVGTGTAFDASSPFFLSSVLPLVSVGTTFSASCIGSEERSVGGVVLAAGGEEEVEGEKGWWSSSGSEWGNAGECSACWFVLSDSPTVITTNFFRFKRSLRLG